MVGVNTGKSKRSAEAKALALPTGKVDLKTIFGSSVIDQFVQAHSPADVFRELVQNEYDAHGSEIVIRFGQDMLSISGTGKPVNAKGWSRLKVIMGTGTALGDGEREEIEAKQSGIGSKNFGIRSLFLFGNQINVRSDGKYAVIDMAKFGAGVGPDPDTKGRKGILIQVPYRIEAIRALKAFTIERENEAMDLIESALLPTLIKLANPRKGPGINALTVISERTGRELRWRQTAEVVKSGQEGIAVTRRKGRLVAIDAEGNRTTKTNEQLEFAASVEIPADSVDLDFPAYYRAGNRFRFSLSVQMKGKSPDLSQQGRLYYPLEAGLAFTGMAMSASAPFQLDAERTRLIPSSWNTWLLQLCAWLALELVGRDWLARFGSSGFGVLTSNNQGGPESLQAWVYKGLLNAECWPTEMPNKLAKAADLHIPVAAEIETFLPKEKTLLRSLAAIPVLKELAVTSGARIFSVNSLVRLRCAGEGGRELATKLTAQESNQYFSAGLAHLWVQANTAWVVDKLSKELSFANRQDLRDTVSTMAADGTTLKAAKELVLVPADMHETCPVPPSDRLHPDLNDYTAVSGFCQSFNISNWMIKAADRARLGEISLEEHETLHRYVMAPETKITSEALAVLRVSPVFKDDQGNWAAPENLAILPSRDAGVLGIVRRPPDGAAMRLPDLLKRFGIRRVVNAVDLLEAATKISAHPEIAAAFEDVLRRHSDLLGKKEIAALADIAFLRTRGGNLAAPSALHLPSILNDSCLDDPDLLVVDSNIALHRQLGCAETPNSNVLLDVICRARDENRSPPRPDLLYPALVQALTSEDYPPSMYSDDPIIYIDGEYVAPEDCLVSSKPPACLKGAIPIHRGTGLVAAALLGLGASSVPTDRHWVALFTSLDRIASVREGRPLSRDAREAVRSAYRLLSRPPHFDFKKLGHETRFLLADDGTLHSLAELEAGTFLEDDYQELASALRSADAPVAFADRDHDGRFLFRRLGVRLLSRICGSPRIVVGNLVEAQGWHRGHISNLLAQIHRDDLGYAIAELGFARQSSTFLPTRSTELRKRLKAITEIRFVDKVERQYELAKRVSVEAEATLDGNRFVLRPPRYKSEFDLLLASEIAVLAGATDIVDIRGMASTIAQLLGIKVHPEMLSFLRHHGIEPKLFKFAKDASDESEMPDDGNHDGDDADILGAAGILGDLVKTIVVAPPSPTTPPAPVAVQSHPPTPVPTPAPAPAVLPPITSVTLIVAKPSKAPPTLQLLRSRGSRGGVIAGWAPPTIADIQRDREVGRRAEELIYRQELERVRALGHHKPEELVIWVSDTAPGADHDIRSIDSNGQPLWIEVKGTTGTDGRFDWSIAEFEKALREGARYHLWRVYRVGSENPVAMVFENPAQLWKEKRLNIEIGTIRAAVEAI